MKLLLCIIGAVVMMLCHPQSTHASLRVDPDSTMALATQDSTDNDLEYEKSKPVLRKPMKVGLSGSFDHLTDSMEAWNEVTANFSSKLREGRTIYGSISQQERFGYRDFEAQAGIYERLSPKWLLIAELKGSPTHEVVPIWAAFAQIEYGLGKGWRTGIGGRHAVYDQGAAGSKAVNVGSFLLEKYFGNWRAAYTLFTSNLRDTVDLRLSHLGQLDYYYGGYEHDVSHIGIGFSAGVEAAEFVYANIYGLGLKSFFLRGEHWFTPRWALTYGARTNQQEHYSRYGIQLGVDHRLGADR